MEPASSGLLPAAAVLHPKALRPSQQVASVLRAMVRLELATLAQEQQHLEALAAQGAEAHLQAALALSQSEAWELLRLQGPLALLHVPA